MATYLENLVIARDNVALKLVEVTAAGAGGLRPSYSIDGQSVSWESYYRMLFDQQKALNDLINALNPYSIKSQVL